MNGGSPGAARNSSLFLCVRVGGLIKDDGSCTYMNRGIVIVHCQIRSSWRHDQAI